MELDYTVPLPPKELVGEYTWTNDEGVQCRSVIKVSNVFWSSKDILYGYAVIVKYRQKQVVPKKHWWQHLMPESKKKWRKIWSFDANGCLTYQNSINRNELGGISSEFQKVGLNCGIEITSKLLDLVFQKIDQELLEYISVVKLHGKQKLALVS